MSFSDGIQNIAFLDEITSIQTEVDKLANSAVDIVIVLGHGGIEMDKAVAEQVAGVDLVVGGHSNTFLYTGQHEFIISQTRNIFVHDWFILYTVKPTKWPEINVVHSLFQKVV